MSKEYDIFKHVDEHITRQRIDLGRNNEHFYPSEASVKYIDKHGDLVTEGKCLRAIYFRMTNGVKRIPNTAKTEFIFRLGSGVEHILVEEFKQMGIWVDNNVKFYNKQWNISGEVDAVLREPDGTVYPAEIKSFYGYMAESQILGTKRKPGYPKLDQLMQLLVYLNEFRDKFPYGRMIYLERGGGKRTSFLVELTEKDGLTYPIVNGKINTSFSVEDVYQRFLTVQEYIDKKEVPPADYELQYSDEKIVDYAKKGKVGKTKFELWQKGRLKKDEYIGDWRCGYCNYKNVCYGVDKAF